MQRDDICGIMEPEQTEDKMYCANCGKELVEGARFCAVCGSQAVAGEPVAAATEAPVAEAGGVSAAFASGRTRSRLRMSPLILLVLALALTSGIAAAAVYVYTQVYLPSVENATHETYATDQEIEFSEPLRSALMPQVDLNGDGRIVYSEVENTTELVLSDPGITDISELAVFSNLMSLNLNGTGITSASLPGMSSLSSIDAVETPLESLDVSSDSQLSHLTCGDAVSVMGIEDTQLVERWLMTSYTCKGMPGAQIQQGHIHPYDEFSMSFEYDDEGRLMSKSKFAASDEYLNVTSDSVTYTYDTEGRCVSATSNTGATTKCSYEGDRIVSVVSTGISYPTSNSYTYDSNGNISTSEISYSDGAHYDTQYECDERGRILRQTSNYSSGASNGMSYSYDENGNIVHVSGGQGSDYPYDLYYNYDSEGRRVSFRSTNYLFPHTDTWGYDDVGHLAWANRMYGDGHSNNSYDATFSCDAHGNVIESVLSYSGERDPRFEDEYSGVSHFSYKRAFIRADSVEQAPPIVLEDPMATPTEHEPWDVYLPESYRTY